jgi:hypothetical protein
MLSGFSGLGLDDLLFGRLLISDEAGISDKNRDGTVGS